MRSTAHTAGIANGRPGMEGASPPDTPTGAAALLSRFDALAVAAARLHGSAEDVFGALLAGTYPPARRAGWTRRPLWNEEAIHRAYRLLLLLQRLRAFREEFEYGWHADYALAQQLAVDFRSLSVTEETEPVACSMVLRRIVHGLCSLFGPAAGDIELKTTIEPLSLPAFHRRALVLAASELVVNALTHAFVGRVRGRIDVRLRGAEGACACLYVEDDGVGDFAEDADTSASLAGRLADLFDGRLVYHAGRAGTTAAEIVFRLPRSTPATTFRHPVAASRPPVERRRHDPVRVTPALPSVGQEAGVP